MLLNYSFSYFSLNVNISCPESLHLQFFFFGEIFSGGGGFELWISLLKTLVNAI